MLPPGFPAASRRWVKAALALPLAALLVASTAVPASAQMTGAARTSYLKWSTSSCIRNGSATRGLLRLARVNASPQAVRQFCSCTARTEANRLPNKYSGDQFMSAVRRAITSCLQRRR
jgi:hypothetical protein